MDHVLVIGGSFAVGLLAASEQIPGEAVGPYALCGELSLTGTLRPVRGGLALCARGSLHLRARGGAPTRGCRSSHR